MPHILIKGEAMLVALMCMCLYACAPENPLPTLSPPLSTTTPKAVPATRAPSPTPTISPTGRPASTLTDTPTSIPTATFTPTPHPEILGATIDGLRARTYPGGQIKVTGIYSVTDAYTRTLITYPSDGLKISGMMNIPFGTGPFPVVIMNHGYIAPSQYVTGSDTWRAADILARNGYLTLAPDFRGYARSDQGLNLYRAGFMVDALNAVGSVKSLPYADARNIGIWGHSMGGGVTTRAMVVSNQIKAAVLYGPVSADFNEPRYFYAFGGEGIDQVSPDLFDSVYFWTNDKQLIHDLSPINYLRNVTAAVSIHQGTADTTTPKEWAEAIRDGLFAAGKNVEFFEYPGQGHAFSGASWDLFNQRVVNFFDRNLK